jgi:CHAT domain-containing protein
MLKQLIYSMLGVLLFTGIGYSKENRAEKLCNSEIKKEQPNKEVLKKQCSIAAKEFEKKKEYGSASWYYLLVGAHTYNIHILQKKLSKSDNSSNVGHSYILKGNFSRAREMYLRFLKSASLPWADEAMQYDYKLLYRLYPKQKAKLNKGLALWNDIYRPLLDINGLYPQYKKAEKENNYQLARKYLSVILQIQMKYQNSHSLGVCDSLMGIGQLYYHEKNYKKSIEVFKIIEHEYIHELDNNYKINVFKWLRTVLSDNNQLSKSISYDLKIIKSVKAISNKNSKELLKEYLVIGISYMNLYNEQNASKYLKSGLSLSLKTKNYNESFLFYKALGKLYSKIDTNRALSYMQKALELNKKNQFKKEQTASLFNFLGTLYHEKGEYEQAINSFQNGLKILKNNSDSDELKRGIYSNIGMSYMILDENQTRAIKYINKSFGRDLKSINAAKSFRFLANVYRMSGDYKKALENYNKCLSIYSKSPYSLYELSVLYLDLSFFYRSIDNIENAFKYAKRSYQIKNTIFGNNHIEMAPEYVNLSYIYRLKNNYKEAIKYAKKSLKLYEDNKGYFSEGTSNAFGSLSQIFNDLGDGAKAIKYAGNAYEIDVKIFGQNNTRPATSLANLGSLFEQYGYYKDARKFWNKALDIFSKKYGPENIKTLKIYMYLAGNASHFSDMEKAEEYYDKSIKIGEKNNYSMDNFYYNYAVYLAENNDFNKALTYWNKALNEFSKHRTYQRYGKREYLLGVALGNFKVRDFLKAYEVTKNSLDILIAEKDELFNILNQKQKKLFLSSNTHVINLYLKVAYLHKETTPNTQKTKTINQEVFNNWLNYKGSILASENIITTIYEHTKDAKLKEQIEELRSTQRTYAKLMQTTPKGKEVASYKIRLKTLSSKIDTLNSTIASKSQSFKEVLALKNIDYKDVAKGLKKEELYIDYAKAGDYYYVFTVDKKEHVTFTQIDSNSSKKIDTLVKRFRQDVHTILKNMGKLTPKEFATLTSKETQSSKKSLATLYTLLIQQPLGTLLQTRQSLIISPDGALRLLPFEALYNEKNKRYLLEEKKVRYIPSGKELVRLYRYNQTNTKGVHTLKEKNALAVFYYPDYKNAQSDKENNTKKEDTTNTFSSSLRGAENFDGLGFKFNPLEGSKQEYYQIKKRFTDAVVPYKNDNANEKNLFSLKTPKILHLSTHGFFLNNANIINPMLKSGILLAGAGAARMAGRDEGIVTALKLSGLDLKGTDLVVLSACNTATVDINATEGISGLNKAFIQAGAKGVLSTLWSVADKQSATLMTTFYDTLAKQQNTHTASPKLNYSKALRKAKLSMIAQDLHPFFWGGFVLVGE